MQQNPTPGKSRCRAKSNEERSMNFSLITEIGQTRRRVRAFVEKHIIPLEREPASYDPHENIDPELLGRLQAKARAEGLRSLQMQKARRGGGLTKVGMGRATRR